MMNRKNQRQRIVALLIIALLPALAEAMDFQRIVVYGAGRLDSKNVFALTGHAIFAREAANALDLN